MATTRFLSSLGLAAALGCVAAGGALAMTTGDPAPVGTSSSQSSGENALLYAQAEAAIDAGDYQGALAPLQQVAAAEPGNADALNLLGYASRQLEQYAEAMEYYERALAADPEHLGANEYYGELMLTLGNLAAAEERLAVLDEVCYLGCDEYDALEAAIEEFMTAE